MRAWCSARAGPFFVARNRPNETLARIFHADEPRRHESVGGAAEQCARGSLRARAARPGQASRAEQARWREPRRRRGQEKKRGAEAVRGACGLADPTTQGDVASTETQPEKKLSSTMDDARQGMRGGGGIDRQWLSGSGSTSTLCSVCEAVWAGHWQHVPCLLAMGTWCCDRRARFPMSKACYDPAFTVLLSAPAWGRDEICPLQGRRQRRIPPSGSAAIGR